MKSDVEQELAHILLIELLAHQFTYPVRWIETQDILLMEQGVERLVEIGPNATLTNMAKRTIENLYDGCDPLIKHREFLSAVRDSDKVYYRTEPVMEEMPSAKIPEFNTTKVTLLTTDFTLQAPIHAVSSVNDIDLKAGYILRTIIANKLKKTTSEIHSTSTLKHLAGGRSTLENEVVGDLLVEFKHLPDRPEEQTIETLCEALETGYNGQFGGYTSSQITRLFSSRMPGGFTVDTAKTYLETTWGLKNGRRNMVLLLASTCAPSARLKTYEAAEQYFDDLVSKHAAETATTIQKGSQTQSPAQSATVDLSVLKDIDKARKDLSHKKLEVYAQDLGIDLKAGEKQAATSQIALNEALGELDLWNAEHGPAYAAGIKPIVQPAKARNFQSWSHWARQDATILFHQIMNGELEHDEQTLATRILHISNCADQALVQEIKAFVELAKQSFGDAGVAKSTIFESLATMCERAISTAPVFRSTHRNLKPVTEIDIEGEVSTKEVPRTPISNLHTTILALEKDAIITETHEAVNLEYPDINIKTRSSSEWRVNENVSLAYIRDIHQICNSGVSFEGKKVLITGAGPNSIGSEILKGLLSGGAQVLCTTSNLSCETADNFRNIYSTYGSRGSRLVILPFNQASQQDIEALVSYIYGSDGLHWDLDLIVPFAAISEGGRDIDQIDARSELAHRAMLTNTIRLLGSVKRQKQTRNIETRPVQVILPLSSNHGSIGQDGLYAESKLALEGLLHKWRSEEWSSYLSLCGAEIGWTRGTGLMNSNDVVAQEVEQLGIRTFSRVEMAANILALCAPSVAQYCQEEPVLIDLNGGLDKVWDIGLKLKRIRSRIEETKVTLRSISAEKKHDNILVNGHEHTTSDGLQVPDSKSTVQSAPLSTLPDLNYDKQIESLASKLQGMVDLDRVAVITGFAELGPFGSARTRMEMELQNGFTDSGCIELACTMGLIKKPTKTSDTSHWIDSETGEPIHESMIKAKYEERILQNTGIRLIKSEARDQQVLQEIVLEADLPPFSTTAQTAIEYAQLHGQKAEIWQQPGSQDWLVQLKAGATMMIPKAANRANPAVGHLPTGWNPKHYGIDESIISQLDNISLYALVATVEALLVSGIPDFYSLYTRIHPSEVANCIGSGQGGISSLRSLYRDRFIDQSVQHDILQETFANTTGAWINMLLLGASGPIRTPVGACATALESLDSAVELITAGKAKLALVGGVDDWTPENGAEFRSMRATVDTTAEQTAGREPHEFSRPMATTRAGFIEGQGAGIQVVTSARLALNLGLPIHGIVAFTGLAADKPSRSVPAPGKGLLNLAAAAEQSPFPSPLLDISYRRRILERKLAQIEESRISELADLHLETSQSAATTPHNNEKIDYITSRTTSINRSANLAQASARHSLGSNLHHQDPRISPLAAALATWGLTADAISVLCMHGTSTVKGDSNEASVLNSQLVALQRSAATPAALAVCSKSLTGHAKGAAGAWSLNTGLQILATGLVPRNRNLDDLAPELSGLRHVSFLGGRGPAVKVAGGVDVISVSAFGFGQKGAQALIVHPRFLFAVLQGGKGEFETYWQKMKARLRVARRELGDGMWKGDLVGKRIKNAGVWEGKGRGGEQDVLLDRGWRA